MQPPEQEIDALMPLVYDELKRIAGGMLRDAPPMTLQPTALVHEAFLKAHEQTRIEWNDEVHFRAVCAIAMRRVLIDHARARGADKRGGDWSRVGLSAIEHFDQRIDATALEDALQVLEQSSPRHARLVEMRFFGGLSVAQAASRLDVSLSTAEADWRTARAWLGARLANDTRL